MEQNYCGDCSLCCKLFAIDELGKVADEWCVNCNSKRTRCTKYVERPPSCSEFECEWFKSQSDKHKMAWNLRPDKSHVVLTDGVAHVDTEYPEAWRQGPMGRKLSSIAESGVRYAIRVGRRRIGFIGGRAITWINPQ